MRSARDNAETERVRRLQDREARRYDRQISVCERVLFGDGRRWAVRAGARRCARAGDRHRRNLQYHPADVSLTGVELSPEMLAIGRRRAEQLGRRVDLRVGDAQALELANESFDTVVCTLGLCTIPDPRRAGAEARRVLRPGGHLLLLESTSAARCVPYA